VALGTEVQAVTTKFMADPVPLVAEVSTANRNEFVFYETGSPDQATAHSTYYNFVGMLHDLLSDGLGRVPSRYEQQQRSLRELLGCPR
jgi:hypothetical protein